nr:hypothetical protein [uncultured Brevundimonas sp.]
MTDAQREVQAVTIEVVNADGMSLIGAQIQVFKGSELIGEATSSGTTTLQFEDLDALTIEASIGGVRRSIRAPRGGEVHQLILPIARFVEVAAIPIARCADGTSGQPCVTCKVGGKEIKICA